jgi:outer membrane protein TolC
MFHRVLAGLACAAALTASTPSPTSAAETRALSLQQCIDLALSRNLDLQIQRTTAELAGYSLKGAYGPYIPVFSFGASHGYIDAPADFDPRKFNPYFPTVLNTDTLGPKLTGELPVGLSYGLSALVREDNARTDFTSNPGDAAAFPGGIRQTNNYFSETRLTLTQHLLKDFWIDSNRMTIRVRRKEVSMSQQAVRFQVMQTILAVEVAYYDMIAARDEIGVQEKAVALAQQFVDETRRRVQVGDAPVLDRDQAESQLETTLTLLTSARENYVTRQNALKKLFTDNFLEWADLDLQLTDALLAIPPAVDRSESFRNALKNRPDLIAARLAVEKQGVIVKFQHNQLFPNLDVVGRYGGLGVNSDYGSSINQAFSFNNPDYFYGVVLSFPLSLSAERGNYRASRAAKEIAELQLKKAEEEVLVQIADYASRVQARFSQVGSARKARVFAEAALAAEQKKFQNGLSTSFFVLQLQQTLTTARMTELQALVDYNKALAQLAFADATTMEKHHLTVESH